MGTAAPSPSLIRYCPLSHCPQWLFSSGFPFQQEVIAFPCDICSVWFYDLGQTVLGPTFTTEKKKVEEEAVNWLTPKDPHSQPPV